MNHSEGREGARSFPVQPEVVPAEDEIDLFDYIEVIVRRRWLIFWGTVVCTLAASGYARLQPVSYRAEAYVLPSQERDLNLDAKSAGFVRRSGEYLEALKGPSIGRGVLDRAVPLTADGEADSVRLQDYFGRDNVKQALDGLAACSEFEQDASGVITIAVTLRDSTLAAAVANTYVKELIVFYTEKQRRQAQEDLAFIASRLKALEAELRAAEDSLAAFQKDNRLVEGNVVFRDPEFSFKLSQLQRQVDLRSSLYTTLANQYELARIAARREAPTFEVLRYARPVEAVLRSPGWVVPISAAVGLFVSVFLAFFLEYVQRNRESGRMEPILKELGEDVARLRRLLGRGGR